MGMRSCKYYCFQNPKQEVLHLERPQVSMVQFQAYFHQILSPPYIHPQISSWNGQKAPLKNHTPQVLQSFNNSILRISTLTMQRKISSPHINKTQNSAKNTKCKLSKRSVPVFVVDFSDQSHLTSTETTLETTPVTISANVVTM